MSFRTYVGTYVRHLRPSSQDWRSDKRTFLRTHTFTLNTACLQVHRDRGGAGGRRPAGFAGRGRVGGPCRMVPTDQRRGGAAGHRSGVSSPPSCLEWCRYVRTVCTVSWRLATHICTHEPRYRQSTCTYRTRLHFVRLCVSQSCAGSLERGQAGTYVRAVCTDVRAYPTPSRSQSLVPRSIILRRGAPPRRPVSRVAHAEGPLRHLVLGET